MTLNSYSVAVTVDFTLETPITDLYGLPTEHSGPPSLCQRNRKIMLILSSQSPIWQHVHITSFVFLNSPNPKR